MASIIFPKPNHGGIMILKNGESITYGSIRVKDGFFYYYTSMGLKALYNPKMTLEEILVALELRESTEDELIASGHIGKIPVGDVLAFSS